MSSISTQKITAVYAFLLLLLFSLVVVESNSITHSSYEPGPTNDSIRDATTALPPLDLATADNRTINASRPDGATGSGVDVRSNKTDTMLSRLAKYFKIREKCPEHEPDEETNSTAGKFCPPVADILLCFPKTSVNQTLRIKCPYRDDLKAIDSNVFMTKQCYANGTWAASDYLECGKHLVRILYQSECRTRNRTSLNAQNVECDELIKPNDSLYKSMATLNAVGFGITILFVSTAILIFISIRSLRCLRNMIHCNLLLTFLLKGITFVCFYLFVLSEGDNVWKYNHFLCIIFNIFWNYSLLAGFFWMMIEAVYLITVIVAAYSSNKIKLWWYLIIGWVIPLIPIIPYSTFTYLSSNTACSWIKPEYQSNHEIFIDGPIYIVLAINLVLLIIILYVIVTKLKNHNDAVRNKYSQYKKLIKATLLLFPLFGLTFAVFFWHPHEAKTTFSKIYFFVNIFLQTSQGVWVSLFYCFLNDEVKNALHTKFRSWKVSHVGTNLYQLGSGAGSTRHHHASPTSCTTQITSNYITRYRTDSAPQDPSRIQAERLPMLPEDRI